MAVALFLALLLRRAWRAAGEGAAEAAAESGASVFLEKLAIPLLPSSSTSPGPRAKGGNALAVRDETETADRGGGGL